MPTEFRLISNAGDVWFRCCSKFRSFVGEQKIVIDSSSFKAIAENGKKNIEIVVALLSVWMR